MATGQIVEITEQTPIAMCTVGQLIGFIKRNGLTITEKRRRKSESGGVNSARLKRDMEKVIKDTLSNSRNENTPRKLFGLEGIMEEFHVSRSTALKYRKTIFKSIVTKVGRKLVIEDVDKAWAIYRASGYCKTRKRRQAPARTKKIQA